MPRHALKIEYDGGPFAGWQRQKGVPTVQATVEEALMRLDADMPPITAAGRTDSGVHALGQVAHCEMSRSWDPPRLSAALNYHMRPAPVTVLAAARVADSFNARFDAVERRYVYRLVSRTGPATHDRGRVWQVSHPLSLHPMQLAARMLVGQHDFTTFRAAHCQASSPIRTVDRFFVRQIALREGVEYRFEVCARSFLHNQVRSMVGTIERVGSGAWSPDQVRDALEAMDRAACGPVAPPQGLYLAAVGYPRDPFRGAPLSGPSMLAIG
ncbi:MAG TPA: tRNA pseudouridine(38-40) synthase TruA [Rhodobacteraceae bacterium]|jgi:tRNA pseudouridine38-40 synthase|nr:tRNA pseudouridine(38-40) synthase TruA [Paracoccaceae bacterium]HBG97431.1 tRNA pseudouridine(38-40) synthase TruA [Paracoccaceae bacterium]